MHMVLSFQLVSTLVTDTWSKFLYGYLNIVKCLCIQVPDSVKAPLSIKSSAQGTVNPPSKNPSPALFRRLSHSSPLRPNGSQARTDLTQFQPITVRPPDLASSQSQANNEPQQHRARRGRQRAAQHQHSLYSRKRADVRYRKRRTPVPFLLY